MAAKPRTGSNQGDLSGTSGAPRPWDYEKNRQEVSAPCWPSSWKARNLPFLFWKRYGWSNLQKASAEWRLLITYPTTQTHADVPEEIRERNGITRSTLRLSVGIEDAQDLLEELEKVFAETEEELNGGKKSWFWQIINRKNTRCLKYDFAVKRGKPADVLPLWVAGWFWGEAETEKREAFSSSATRTTRSEESGRKRSRLVIGDLCVQYGVTVVSDEIHADFIFQRRASGVCRNQRVRGYHHYLHRAEQDVQPGGAWWCRISYRQPGTRAKFQKQLDAAGTSQLWRDGPCAPARQRTTRAKSGMRRCFPYVKCGIHKNSMEEQPGEDDRPGRNVPCMAWFPRDGAFSRWTGKTWSSTRRSCGLTAARFSGTADAASSGSASPARAQPDQASTGSGRD